ncbi:MAG: gamma-glutamyltransferase family protein, partial [Alphaproteobacteria bacterium]|nr:gamma-glutamyltransferase family protein [Alphaproteobacteria bacterium]
GLTTSLLYNLIDGIDLGAMGHNSVDYIHTLTEAVKLSMADREAYVGDPAFVDVPVRAILDKAFAAKRRARIDPLKAFPGFPPSAAQTGDGPPSPRDRTQQQSGGGARAAARDMTRPESDHATSIVCVVDSEGNVFTSMPSGSFLDAPVVPGTGLAISGYGKLSTANPEHPNCVAPGKRPRCIYPAIAMRSDGLVMPFGSPGSDVIPQATIQVFLNIFVFGMDPQSACEAPRFASYSFPQPFEPHEILSGVLRLEGRIEDETGHALAARGHKVEWWPKRDWLAASVVAILRDPDTSILYGGVDPRRNAWAVGY